MKIVVSDQLINYSDEGDGKVILFLHGWGANLRTFDGLSAGLAEKYRIVRLDFPGFGESSLPPSDWALDDYAQLTRAFLAKIKVRDVFAVIAHSFGGRVIIKAASQNYLAPQKIILVDSGGIKHSQSTRNQAYKMLAKTGKQVARLPGFRKFHGKLRQWLYTSAGSMDYIEAGELQQIFLRVIDEDARQVAKVITQPTLLLWGEDDADTPLADAKILHQDIAGSQLVVLPGAGHFAYIDKPNEALDAIKAFL